MLQTPLLTLLAVSVFTLSAPGQQKPDFSGRWTFSKAKSKLQLESLAGLERGTVRIEHREPRFKFERTFTVSGKDSTYSYELTTDGREVATGEGGQKHFSKLYWEGNSLVFATRIVAPQGEATNVVHYRLLDGGRALQAEEQFRGPRLKYDNLWVFEKQ